MCLVRQADGSPWAKGNQQPRMRAALKKAGIKRHVRFHDLRHTFATLLTRQGVSIQVVADQLGHSGTRVKSITAAIRPSTSLPRCAARSRSCRLTG
jgi:integrase